MSKRELTEKKLALPQVKRELAAIGEENLDQFQRRTFDYVSKFSRMDAAAVEGLLERLVKEFGLEEAEAIQIVNCAPESVEEIRDCYGEAVRGVRLCAGFLAARPSWCSRCGEGWLPSGSADSVCW